MRPGAVLTTLVCGKLDNCAAEVSLLVLHSAAGCNFYGKVLMEPWKSILLVLLRKHHAIIMVPLEG